MSTHTHEHMYEDIGVGGAAGPRGAQSGRWGMVVGIAVWVKADGGGARGECRSGWRVCRGQ